MQDYTKRFIEDYIELIDDNKINDLFEAAIIEAELTEDQFNELCVILENIDIDAFDERDKLFLNLFDQYIEINESDYVKNDADRLVEMMDTMSTAGCLGLSYSGIIELLYKWDRENPGHIGIEGTNLNNLKIRFLNGSKEEIDD